jgi:DNA-binding NtrC family response regulator
MKREIVILGADGKQCQVLCSMLEELNYPAIPIQSLTNLERYLRGSTSMAVILDIDTVPVNNRVIRELTVKNPGIYFLCLSKDHFHPELKDAIGFHIYACLNKPVDRDELTYWLRSIYENEAYEKKEKPVSHRLNINIKKADTTSGVGHKKRIGEYEL